MTVIEYIDKTWIAYKKNFWSIIIALIIQILISSVPIIIGLLPWIFILPFSKGALITSLILSNLGVLSFSIIMFIIGILVSVVLNGGFVRMLYEALRRKTRFEIMLKTAKERFWTILGANLIVLLIFLVIITVLFAPIAILFGFSNLSFQSSSFLYLVAVFSVLILGIIVLVFVSIFFVFVNQAIVIDNLRAVQAVKKSFEVSKKNFLSIFFLFLIFFIFNSGLYNVFSIFGSIIAWFVTTPLLLLCYTAFYVDKRKKIK